MRTRGDSRLFCATDRPGERLAVSRPLPGVKLLSVRHSHRYWREAHDSFVFTAVYREQDELVAEWRTRGRSLLSRPGDIMGMEPGDVHVTQRLTARRGAASFDVVQFSPELVNEACDALDVSRFHFRSPAMTDPIAFDALMTFVDAATSEMDALSLESMKAQALASLLTRLGERNERACATLDVHRDFRLRRVRDYLAANLVERPKLSELERVSGLSRFRLCTLFKRSFGTSVGEYWNALRLGRAVRKLEQGECIKLLIAELGYLEASYFSRVFKQHYGVPPGRWRSMLRANDPRPDSRMTCVVSAAMRDATSEQRAVPGRRS
jgi:AraC-like DNA-binding protein